MSSTTSRSTTCPVATDLSAELPPEQLLGVDPARIAAAADRLLSILDLQDSELSILLCDDAEIQQMNAQWRGKDAPTDVLSFPQRAYRVPWRQGRDPVPPVLGDIAISIETARKQAGDLGHSCETEILVLVVHGLLHLLGHDHEPPCDPTPMREEEARLIGRLGVEPAAALITRSG